MAKLGSYRSNNEQTENPTSIYLDNIKWQLWVWNKGKWENDFHTLDKFIVLTVWYTIKWKVWDDNLKQYTNTYYSNEIRQFNETLYAIDMQFINWQAIKNLAAKGKWKTDVKPLMPQWVGMKAMITVLDLNDGIVKAFPVALTQYFGEDGLQKQIESYEPTDVLSYSITKMYTNWKKDVSGNEVLISEKELDAMKWSEAATYKNRYISKIKRVSEGDQESIEAAEELMDKVEEYNLSKKAYYAKTFWEWSEEEDKTYKPTKEQLWGTDEVEPVMKAQWKTSKVNSSEELDISDLPF